MARLVAILIIILFIIGAAVWFLQAISAAALAFLRATEDELRGLGRALFGRQGRAVLIEPPELEVKLPEPSHDTIARRLEELRFEPPGGSWPVWQSPWQPISPVATTVYVSDVDQLFQPLADCSPPYGLLDEPIPEWPVASAPEEPRELHVHFPSPDLRLPRWTGVLGFLNAFVDHVHRDVRERHAALQRKASQLQQTATELNKRRRMAWESAVRRYGEYVEKRKQALSAYTQQRAQDVEPLARARSLMEQRNEDGIALHFEFALRRLQLPSFIPRESSLLFDKDTATILVEHRFPETARLQLFVQPRPGVTKPATKTIMKTLIPRVQPALCLQLARAIAQADSYNVLQAIAVNGWVDFFERSTGHPKRAYCASLVASKDALLSIRVDTADLVAAFSKLRGAAAGTTYETAPVMPSLRLDTSDPRFVEARETLSTLETGENLAAMKWDDFEHLIRELFEREFAESGAEVKVTRVSRDHGVDAIIFDPDPLRGGKIAIQAKRYTLPVDVSAVRDLYGTVMNEGANTGILVTTSSFGPDAYEFAQNKPLKLLNGAQLLGLLQRRGYQFRIDLAEARALTANDGRTPKEPSTDRRRNF